MDWLAARREQAHKERKGAQTAGRRRSSSVAGLEVDRFRAFKTRRRSSLLPYNDMDSLRLTGVDTKPSAFLALPAEIRNVIYAAVFEDDIPRIKPTYELPGILKTSRQTFSEAIGIYYSSTPFRCLEEDSAVSWLCALPKRYLDLMSEVRYDTRWIVFSRPVIPVNGVECWLYRNLMRKLVEKGFDLRTLDGEAEGNSKERRTGKLKVSFYQKGSEGNGIVWTDKPGLIEVVEQ